jgi:WXXGXW repeat (2 copies)
MNRKWFCGAVLAAASLTASAFSQLHVYIGTPPPPIRYEVRPPMPGEGYSWVDGYWGNEGGHYRWVAGRWNQPPYQGAYWNHPHYDHYQKGWQMHEGHWDHEDHDNHHDDGHDGGHDNGHH